MKTIASITEARRDVDVCTLNYRYSSALRLGMFLDALDSEDINGFCIYKVTCKYSNDPNHFDIVIVTCNGVICSTGNEYLEYGFYDRHILALFINGYISLYPTHQCSEFWLKPLDEKPLQHVLTVNWNLQTAVSKQSYEYHELYSRFDTAYTLTASTFDKVKNPLQTVTLETAMKFVSTQNVKEEKLQDTAKQCLIDLKVLKLYNYPELMEQLVKFTSLAKETCRKKLGKRSLSVMDERGEHVEIMQPALYQTNRQSTKRCRVGEINHLSTPETPSLMDKVCNVLGNFISANK